MAMHLPPDLERVGDDLAAAAARALAARRRRRRLLARIASTAGAALVAAAWLVPGALGPAGRASDLLLARAPTIETPGLPVACDQPRGGRLALPACATGEPIRVGRPRRW
jgi:hypothetical protein